MTDSRNTTAITHHSLPVEDGAIPLTIARASVDPASER